MATIDETLDLIYDEVDDLLDNREYEYVNTFLAHYPVEGQHIVVLLSFLSLTVLVDRELLPDRSSFYRRVEDEFRQRMSGEETQELLKGLY